MYLCPKPLLDDMGVSFSKDEIALTGSKLKQGEADLTVAREVAKGSDTLVLRDDKWNPVWTGTIECHLSLRAPEIRRRARRIERPAQSRK